MIFKRLKNIIRPIYRKFFHHSKPVPKDLPPATCPFTGKSSRKELTDYEQIKQIFSDHQHFATSPCYDNFDPHHILLSAGGKAHDEVAKGTREYISRHRSTLEEEIALIASDLFSQLPLNEIFDFRTVYSDQLAVRSLAAFYGLSVKEQNELSETIRAVSDKNESRSKLASFFSRLLNHTERNQSGFIAHLSRKWIKEGGYIHENVLNLLLLLWEAGIHNTSIGLSRVMEFLLKHPEQWPNLTANSRNQLKFIEEVLRIKSPTIVLSRNVVKDFTIGDHELKAGEQIWLNIQAANLDPNKFDQPEMIQLNGNNHKHLVFGHGIHQCIGMSIVRMQLKAMTEILVPQIHLFELIEYHEMIFKEEAATVSPLTVLNVRYSKKLPDGTS